MSRCVRPLRPPPHTAAEVEIGPELSCAARWATPTGDVDDLDCYITTNVTAVGDATIYVDSLRERCRIDVAGATGSTVPLTVWGSVPADVELARGARLKINVARVKGYGGAVQLSADASALKPGERTCPTPVDLRPLSPPNPRELTEQCVETFYKKVCPERLKKRDFLRNVMRHPDQVIIARCLKAYGTAPTPLKPAAGGDDTF